MTKTITRIIATRTEMAITMMTLTMTTSPSTAVTTTNPINMDNDDDNLRRNNSYGNNDKTSVDDNDFNDDDDDVQSSKVVFFIEATIACSTNLQIFHLLHSFRLSCLKLNRCRHRVDPNLQQP